MCVFNAERLKMDEKTQIPYIVYETEMTRSERNFKRLWVVVIILISLLVTTNLCWLAYESQFETVESTEINAEQDSSGVNTVSYTHLTLPTTPYV